MEYKLKLCKVALT